MMAVQWLAGCVSLCRCLQSLLGVREARKAFINEQDASASELVSGARDVLQRLRLHDPAAMLLRRMLLQLDLGIASTSCLIRLFIMHVPQLIDTFGRINACRALDGAVRSGTAFLKTQTLEITSFGSSFAARLISDDADIVAAALSATELASSLDTISFVSIASTQRSIEVENGLFLSGLEVGHDCLLRALIFPDEVPNSLNKALESARDACPELVLSRGFVPNLAGVVALGGIRRSLLEVLCCLPSAKVSDHFAAFQLDVKVRPLANGAILQCERLRSATVVLRSISGANSGLSERVERAIRRLQSARTDAVVVLGAGAAELSCSRFLLESSSQFCNADREARLMLARCLQDWAEQVQRNRCLLHERRSKALDCFRVKTRSWTVASSFVQMLMNVETIICNRTGSSGRPLSHVGSVRSRQLLLLPITPFK